ncbi:hypothetical protein C8J57DRAFT_1716541 [Mycena rebaudengoi]|nr:hypothetical protein C8J57DRAFT_1716541 [Mycena rebaudengoi]
MRAVATIVLIASVLTALAAPLVRNSGSAVIRRSESETEVLLDWKRSEGGTEAAPDWKRSEGGTESAPDWKRSEGGTHGAPAWKRDD